MPFDRRTFIGAAAAAMLESRAFAQVGSPGPAVIAPKEMQHGEFYEGIIDIYDQNARISLDEAWRLNVRAIIHQTSLGLFREDRLYATRRDAALAKGFLWGAYHVVSAESTDDQLERFLSKESGDDPRILMAVDWEETSHGTMPVAQLREFVAKFAARKGYYPILYGGHLIPDDPDLIRGDAVLGQCPLWYIWIPDRPMRLPRRTWADYTLWQYDTERRTRGAPYPANVLPGADWNRFHGTESDLRSAWPFRRPAPAGGH